MKRWWCMDCRSTVSLNKHGRCEGCESEAVAVVDRRDLPQVRTATASSNATDLPLYA